jgi:hypothetical protein
MVLVIVITGCLGVTYAAVSGQLVNLVISLIANALFIPLGAVLTLIYLSRGHDKDIQRKYLRLATKSPEKLLTGATDSLSTQPRIALRREVFAEVMSSLPGVPHVVIGPAGSGKTTFLQEIVSECARNQAVPVPIRLDRLSDNIDDAVRKSYLDCIDPWVRASSDGDRVWRTVKATNRVVAVCDGVDDWRAKAGLTPGDALRALEDAFRNASYRLVVALRSDSANFTETYPTFVLEPLELDDEQIEAIVRQFPVPLSTELGESFKLAVHAAGSSRTPLFLELTRQLLSRPSALAAASASPTTEHAQIELLDTWLLLQRDRAIARDVNLGDAHSERISSLAAIAYSMSVEGRLEFGGDEARTAIASSNPNAGWRSMVVAYQFGRTLSLLDVAPASDGSGPTFKFRHSLFQVYLTVRHLRERALVASILSVDASPELLLAIRYYSLTCTTSADIAELQDAAISRQTRPVIGPSGWLDLLAHLGHVTDLNRNHVLQLFREGFDQANDDGKLAIIHRFGSLQITSGRYEQLWEWAKSGEFGVAMAAGQELILGGSEAFAEVGDGIARLVRSAQGKKLEELDRPWREAGGLVTLLAVFLPVWAEESSGECHSQISKLRDICLNLVEYGQMGGVEASIVEGVRRALQRNPSSPVWMQMAGLMVHCASYDARLRLVQVIAEQIQRGRSMDSGRDMLQSLAHQDEHPLVFNAAQLALKESRGVRRGEDASVAVWRMGDQRQPKAQARLSPIAHQLLADSYLLIILENQGGGTAEESDRRLKSWRSRQLPYCLSQSEDRSEIFTGCPQQCGFDLCPIRFSFAARRQVSPFSVPFLRKARDLTAKKRPWAKNFRGEAAAEFWLKVERALFVSR